MEYTILCIRAENNSSQKLSQEGKIEQIAVPNSEVHQAANIERKIAHEARKGSVKSRMQQEPSGQKEKPFATFFGLKYLSMHLPQILFFLHKSPESFRSQG